jgi:hypothetical protein
MDHWTPTLYTGAFAGSGLQAVATGAVATGAVALAVQTNLPFTLLHCSDLVPTIALVPEDLQAAPALAVVAAVAETTGMTDIASIAIPTIDKLFNLITDSLYSGRGIGKSFKVTKRLVE